MKVRIKKANKKDWYFNRIGEIFEVVNNNYVFYYILKNIKYNEMSILKCDAEPIEKYRDGLISDIINED